MGYITGMNTIEVIVDNFGIPITRSKILCMRNGIWLNDEIINYCVSMLQLRDDQNPKHTLKSHLFNTFFMDKLLNDSKRYNYNNVKRWTKKFTVADLDKVIIPINILNNHWTLGAIYIQQKKIYFYDPTRGGHGPKYLDVMWNWLQDELRTNNNGQILNKSEWTIESIQVSPLQTNGTDCGVFIIMFMDFICDNLPLNENSFNQSHMPFFRRKIVNDILRGFLNYPF